MGSKSLATPLQSLLKECYPRPHAICLSSSRRGYAKISTKPDASYSLDVAVLGGGITGLTTAYLLSSRPNTRVTLYEQQERLGGWMQSSEVEVDGGRIIFEHGPRSLRPSGASGIATLDLIRRLNLQDEVLTTPKTSPSAKNRYLYYPDHLVRMPGPGTGVGELVSSLLSEKIWRGVLSGPLREYFRPPRPADMEDESIGSFLRRRFSTPMADNIVSAVLHGIYAGDINKLSVKTLMPSMWNLEGEHGSVIRGAAHNMWHKRTNMTRTDYDLLKRLDKYWHDKNGAMLPEVEKLNQIIGSSIYTFRAGLEQLPRALVEELEAAPNVTIRRGVRVRAIERKDGLSTRKMHLTWSKTSDSRRTNKNLEESEKSDAEKESVYHRVVSALPEIPTCVDSEDGRSMAKFSAVSPDSAAAPRTRADMVTVMVVNLYFRTPNLLPVEGFGYLIPRSIPFEQNPERALGVVFDSDAIKGQDSPTGTKLTVMIGGHWWADWQSYPDEQEGLKMARAVVERHLGVREEPEAWKVNLQRDCIPQYHVGHEKWLRNHHTKLLRTFDGKLTVAGAICSGISVNDCVKSAYHVAHAVDNGKDRTGLEDVGERYDPTIRALDGK